MTIQKANANLRKNALPFVTASTEGPIFAASVAHPKKTQAQLPIEKKAVKYGLKEIPGKS
jgi:hypothetical protein